MTSNIALYQICSIKSTGNQKQKSLLLDCPCRKPMPQAAMPQAVVVSNTELSLTLNGKPVASYQFASGSKRQKTTSK